MTKNQRKIIYMNSQQKHSKKQKLSNVYGSYCWWCGKSMSINELTIEHLRPKSCGGSNSLENLRLACLTCNRFRGNSLFPPNVKIK
ncbi:HNH endonuclease [Dolichospermum sp. ST_sed5]|nr:HNH endonuclease [Dolichospermum sp. ST_sed5]